MASTIFKSLNDMITQAVSADSGKEWTDTFTKNFEVGSVKSQYMIEFYNQWSAYLKTVPKISSSLYNIPEFFMKGLYYITLALENIYGNMFKLFGFFDSLSDTNTFIGQFYFYMKVLGMAIGALVLVIHVVSSWFGSNAIARYKDLLGGIIMASFAVSFLPQAISSFANVISASGQSLLSYDTTGQGNDSSIALQPITDNTVDVFQLVKNNFNTETLGYDESTGFLVQSKATVPLNKITKSNITSTNFSSSISVFDKDLLQKFIDKGEEDTTYFGVATVFSHEIGMYVGSDLTDKSDDFNYINKISNSKWNFTGGVYMRYKVNWLALFSQQIIILILLISMTIKFVQSVVNVISFGIFAPVIAFASIGDNRKIKELLLTIFGTISGFFFEIALLKIGLLVMSNVETSSFTLNGVSSGFFEGLGAWESIASRICIYLGVYLAVVGGNKAIENWLGISTRQSGSLGFGLGAVALPTYLASKTGASLAKKGIAKGTDGFKKVLANSSTSSSSDKKSKGVGKSQRESSKNGNQQGKPSVGDKSEGLFTEPEQNVSLFESLGTSTPPSYDFPEDKGYFDSLGSSIPTDPLIPQSAPLQSTETPPVTQSAKPQSAETPLVTQSAKPQSAETPPVTQSAKPQSAETPLVTQSAKPQSVATPPVTQSAKPQSAETPPVTQSAKPQSVATPPVTQSAKPQSVATPPVSQTSKGVGVPERELDNLGGYKKGQSIKLGDL